MEMLTLYQAVDHGVSDSLRLREKVLLGVVTVSQAYLTANTALLNLERLYKSFKTFMEMTPDDDSYQGVEFMIGSERTGCTAPLR